MKQISKKYYINKSKIKKVQQRKIYYKQKSVNDNAERRLII